MKRSVVLALLLACAALLPSSALAQSAPTAAPRGFIAGSVGLQPTSNDFDESTTFQQNVEEGTFDASYAVKSAPFFEVGGGYRFWRNLGVGASVSFLTKKNDASFDLAVPHPFFFNQPRTISGTVDEIERTETGAHLQVLYFLSLSAGVHVILSGGPSILRVKQDLVTGINYSEQYPYDAITLQSAVVESQTKSKVGFNVGADLGWMFTERLGVGGVFRFSRASLEFDPGSDLASDDETVSADVGGFQVAAGIRYYF